MTIKAWLYPLAILPALALSACGDDPDDAVSVQRQPDGSSTVQIQVPNGQQAIDDLRNGAADMTAEAKVQAVAAARATAENAARLIGQSEAEIKAAGDDAERTTREALGLQ